MGSFLGVLQGQRFGPRSPAVFLPYECGALRERFRLVERRPAEDAYPLGQIGERAGGVQLLQPGRVRRTVGPPIPEDNRDAERQAEFEQSRRAAGRWASQAGQSSSHTPVVWAGVWAMSPTVSGP